METLSYNIEINAAPQKVWNILWNEDSYKEWTKFLARIQRCNQTGK